MKQFWSIFRAKFTIFSLFIVNCSNTSLCIIQLLYSAFNDNINITDHRPIHNEDTNPVWNTIDFVVLLTKKKGV